MPLCIVLVQKKTMKLKLLFVIALLGTGTLFAQKVKDNEIIRKVLPVADFQRIGLAISAQVDIRYGAVQQVEFVGPAQLLNEINTEVKHGEWAIEWRSKLKSSSNITLIITLPELRSLAVAGSGSIKALSAFPPTQKLDLTIAGSGKITFMGETADLRVSIAGSGNVTADQVRSKSCVVDIAGSGTAKVNAVEKLTVAIAGSGKVSYQGRPSVKSSIAGSGTIRTVE
jgi:hypothetical protein